VESRCGAPLLDSTGRRGNKEANLGLIAANSNDGKTLVASHNFFHGNSKQALSFRVMLVM
jgi:hypothetical protein